MVKSTTLLFLVISIVLAGCSAAGKFKRSYNPDSIPADIKKEGYVLLVLKQDVGGFKGVQNRGVDKMMRRHYNGAYEMVSTEDLKNSKYDDTTKYRYIIGRNFDAGSVVTTSHINASGHTTRTTHAEYHEEYIFDRKENKSLPAIGYASRSYSLGMKGFAKFMKKRD